ncbi:hypothetical protein [uncultured Alistipes sp.]|uniref:hypothetical protein n=1 Tax=uncultured Alistipes sp. TaxID=538949 RepID=UPI002616FFBC|nr:hypothetical protein [uncultured Alistipes sp.]
MRSTIHSRQSLLDIAVQECGSVEAAFALSERNGIALTDDLAAGQELEVTPEDMGKKRIVTALAAMGVKPATAVSAEDAALVPWGGLGFMGVEIDFIVK